MTGTTEILTTSKILRKSIYSAHGGKCFYTGELLDYNNFNIDHIIPVKIGGLNCIENYVPCLSRINKNKSAKFNFSIQEKLLLLNKLTYVDKVLYYYHRNNKDNTLKNSNNLLEKSNYYKLIAELKSTRKMKNITQMDLACSLKEDRRKIIDMENGKTSDLNLVLKVAEFFNLNILINYE